jgi:hypothetical protein
LLGRLRLAEDMMTSSQSLWFYTALGYVQYQSKRIEMSASFVLLLQQPLVTLVAVPTTMLLNPVYLLIHSRSNTRAPKPYFRIAATELPNLPRPFTGHDHDNYTYTDIHVTASGTPLAEEWIVLLEAIKNSYQEVTAVNHFDTLEEAGQELADLAMADCRGDIGKEGKVIVYWTQSINGNAVTRYRTVEGKFDEETGARVGQREVSHWWEIVQIKLQHDDIYDIQWHDTARIQYMATAQRVAVLTLRAREDDFNNEEERELEGLQKKLGFVNVSEADFERVWGFKKKSEEELRALHVELRRWEDIEDEDILDEEENEAE